MNSLYQLLIMYSLSTASLTAAVLHYTHPFFLLGLRMSLAGALLIAYLALRNRPVLYEQITKRHGILYAQIILFTVLIPYALRYYGLSLASSSCTSNGAVLAPLVYNLGPIVTFFLAHIFGVEKISWPRAAALCVSLVGLLLCLDIPLLSYLSTFIFSIFNLSVLNFSIFNLSGVSALSPASNSPHALFSIFSLPECAIILSLVSFSYGWIIMRKLVVDLNYNPLLVNGIAMFGGGIMGLAASFCLEQAPYMSNCSLVVPLLIITIIISNIVGHSLYASLLRTYSLTLLQLGYWLIPAVTKLGFMLTMSNPLNSTDVCGALLLFFGFWGLYKAENAYPTVRPECIAMPAKAGVSERIEG